MGWKNRPVHIDVLPEGIDYVMFVDESGTSEIKSIKKKLKNNKVITEDEKYFVVTGVVVHKEQLKIISDNITALKNKYWPPYGMASYGGVEKRVCFHSYEIRKRKGVFGSNILNNRVEFLADLTEFLTNVDVTVFSVAIDKEKHCRQYSDPYQPYDLCMEFILERYQSYIPNFTNGVIVLEGRGKKDDKLLLKKIINFIDEGTGYRTKEQLSFVKGVYFNDKWSSIHESRKSYFGLEIADLFCYPIAKYAKTGNKDSAFMTLEAKIYKYPCYTGRGYKIFP